MSEPAPPRRSWSSLKRDTATYAIAIAVDRLSGFLVLPLLTAAMDRSVFGTWNQILTSFALMSNVLEVGFYHSIVRYVPGAPRAEVGRIMHGMLAIFAGNSAIFLLLAFVIPGVISQLLFATQTVANIIPVAALFIISECLFEFLVLAFLRADGRIFSCSVYYVVKNLLRILLLWQGVSSGADLAGLLARLIASNVAIVLAAYVINIRPTVDLAIFGLRRGFWKDVLRHSGAIVLSSNLSWANASLNRFLIVYMLGLADLGVYAANYSLASIVTLAALIINFTVIPHLNAAWNRDDKRRVSALLTTATEYYCFATVPAAAAIGVFYLPLARLLTSEQYIVGGPLIWSLVVFMVLLGLEQLMTFASFLDNSRFSVGIRAVSLAVNLVFNLLLLRTFGITISAIAAALSTSLVVGFNIAFLRRINGYIFPWRSVSMIVAAGATMVTVAWAVLAVAPAQTFGYAVVAGTISLPVYLGIESLQTGSVTRAVLKLLGQTDWRRTFRRLGN